MEIAHKDTALIRAVVRYNTTSLHNLKHMEVESSETVSGYNVVNNRDNMINPTNLDHVMTTADGVGFNSYDEIRSELGSHNNNSEHNIITYSESLCDTVVDSKK